MARRRDRSSEPKFLIHDPRLAWALTVLPKTFTREEAFSAWQNELNGETDSELMWQALTSIGLLQADSAEAAQANPPVLWQRYGWTEAALYTTRRGTIRSYEWTNPGHLRSTRIGCRDT